MEYKIQRWDTGNETGLSEAQLEQYVPPEVESIAWQVMKVYDMNVSAMTLITSKPDKGGAIWRIETSSGPRSLKVLHRAPARSLFSVGAQEYLVQRGARVPALIPTKEEHLYVEAGGKLWIVTDWIEPLQPVSKDLEGAASLCFGLGEFHHLSKGYVPPQGAQNSTRLYKWPAQYQKIIAKFGWFRDLAEALREKPSSQLLLSVIEQFDRGAREVLQRLQNSAYSRMAGMGGPYWGLAHQDYGWSNGQMGPGGIWVIDLDGVAYDFPIRDLRKLITSTMDDMGSWDITWIRGVIDAYHQANPLDRETYELLLLDMAFPNEFYKHVKEIVFDPVQFLDTDFEPIINRILSTEQNKWGVMEELERDSELYSPGDYTPETLYDPFRKRASFMQGGLLPQDDFRFDSVNTVQEELIGGDFPQEKVEFQESELVMAEEPKTDVLESQETVAELQEASPVPQQATMVPEVVSVPANGILLHPAAAVPAAPVGSSRTTRRNTRRWKVVRKRKKRLLIRSKRKTLKASKAWKAAKKTAKMTSRVRRKKTRFVKRKLFLTIRNGIPMLVLKSRKRFGRRAISNRASQRKRLSERRETSMQGRKIH